MAPRKSGTRIVAGPSGPPAPKAWRVGRTKVSEALEALDVGTSLRLEDVTKVEVGRARSSAAYLQRKLGRRYETRLMTGLKVKGFDLVVWRTA